LNLEWITSPLAIYAALAAGGAAALHMMISTRIEMRRQQKRQLANFESLRDAITVLEEQVRQVCAEAAEKVPLPVVNAPLTGLNIHKRAEALRMYRRGSDQQSVSAALGLPPAEVALLAKVNQVLKQSELPSNSGDQCLS